MSELTSLPSSGKKINFSEFNFENINIENKNGLIEELNSYQKNYKVTEYAFDKDNNIHIDFLESLSNLRARNYTISEVDKNKVLMLGAKRNRIK